MGENKEIVEESGMMSQNSPDVERRRLETEPAK